MSSYVIKKIRLSNKWNRTCFCRDDGQWRKQNFMGSVPAAHSFFDFKVAHMKAFSNGWLQGTWGLAVHKITYLSLSTHETIHLHLSIQIAISDHVLHISLFHFVANFRQCVTIFANKFRLIPLFPCWRILVYIPLQSENNVFCCSTISMVDSEPLSYLWPNFYLIKYSLINFLNTEKNQFHWIIIMREQEKTTKTSHETNRTFDKFPSNIHS